MASLSLPTTSLPMPSSPTFPLAATTAVRIVATSSMSATYSTVPWPRASRAVADRRQASAACARPRLRCRSCMGGLRWVGDDWPRSLRGVPLRNTATIVERLRSETHVAEGPRAGKTRLAPGSGPPTPPGAGTGPSGKGGAVPSHREPPADRVARRAVRGAHGRAARRGAPTAATRLGRRPRGRTARRAILVAMAAVAAGAAGCVKTPATTVTPVVTGLDHPWDVAFTPDGTLLYT